MYFEHDNESLSSDFKSLSKFVGMIEDATESTSRSLEGDECTFSTVTTTESAGTAGTSCQLNLDGSVRVVPSRTRTMTKPSTETPTSPRTRTTARKPSKSQAKKNTRLSTTKAQRRKSSIGGSSVRSEREQLTEVERTSPRKPRKPTVKTEKNDESERRVSPRKPSRQKVEERSKETERSPTSRASRSRSDSEKKTEWERNQKRESGRKLKRPKPEKEHINESDTNTKTTSSPKKTSRQKEQKEKETQNLTPMTPSKIRRTKPMQRGKSMKEQLKLAAATKSINCKSDHATMYSSNNSSWKSIQSESGSSRTSVRRGGSSSKRLRSANNTKKLTGGEKESTPYITKPKLKRKKKLPALAVNFEESDFEGASIAESGSLSKISGQSSSDFGDFGTDDVPIMTRKNKRSSARPKTIQEDKEISPSPKSKSNDDWWQTPPQEECHGFDIFDKYRYDSLPEVDETADWLFKVTDKHLTQRGIFDVAPSVKDARIVA